MDQWLVMWSVDRSHADAWHAVGDIWDARVAAWLERLGDEGQAEAAAFGDLLAGCAAFLGWPSDWFDAGYQADAVFGEPHRTVLAKSTVHDELPPLPDLPPLD